MQIRLLEPAENALNGLALAVVWLAADAQVRHLGEQAGRLQLLVAALVVKPHLVGLVSRRLHRHLEGAVLGFIILACADMIAQQHLTVNIHHLIHIASGNLAVIIPIIVVQLRTVAVPQRISLLRQDGAVLAGVFLLCLQLAIAGTIPHRHNLRAVDEPLNGACAAHRLPALYLSLYVVQLKQLRDGAAVNRRSPAGNQPVLGLLRQFLGIALAVGLLHQGRITLTHILIKFLLETSCVQRQHIRVPLAVVFHELHALLPPVLQFLALAASGPCRHLCLPDAHQRVHQTGSVSVQVPTFGGEGLALIVTV